MEAFIIIFGLTLLCAIIFATEISKMDKSTTKNKEETDTTISDDFDVYDICDNLEQRDRTQFDFLSTLAHNVAKHNDSALDNIQALETFGIPCIEQAINTKYPDLSENAKQNTKLTFINACATNSRDMEHLDILKLIIKYLMALDFLASKIHTKIDKSNIKEMISIGMSTIKFPRIFAEYYVSNLSYVREIIENFGTEYDLHNFDTWVTKHEETGTWDWKFFSDTNLGPIFWKGNLKLQNKIDAKIRLDQIKQTLRTNNPIDKSISKALQIGKRTGLTIAYSKFMKYIFWICITIVILTLMILAD